MHLLSSKIHPDGSRQDSTYRMGARRARRSKDCLIHHRRLFKALSRKLLPTQKRKISACRMFSVSPLSISIGSQLPNGGDDADRPGPFAATVGVLALFVLLSGCISPKTPTLFPHTNESTSTAVTLVPVTPFMRGISYSSGKPGEYSSLQSDTTLAQVIKPMGANWIALIVTCYQDNITSTQIRCMTDSSTPTDDDITHAIQYAHSLGIRVMLKPHIELINDPTHWRGEIDFGSDEKAWRAWFEAYTNFVTHYATLAQMTGADYFAVGTELPSTSSRADQWRAVVNSVRAVYSGLLTYAAYPGEEGKVTWWDAVDAIGVDAYYHLTQSNHPTVAELKAAWAPIVSRLGQLSGRWNRPIVLTEAGYRSIDGANQDPSDSQTFGWLDLQEQADCYQALVEAFSGKKWWGGVFWWDWTTNPNQGGYSDTDFTANDKPAENIIRKFYGASLRPTPTPTPAVMVDEKSQLVVYADGLGSGWTNGSWDSTVDLSFRDIDRSGGTVIKVSPRAWGGLSIRHRELDTSPYYWLEFYINGGSEGERQLRIWLSGPADVGLPTGVELANLAYFESGTWLPNRWERIRIPLHDVGASKTMISAVNIQEFTGRGQSDFYVDGIRLIGAVQQR